MSKNRKKRYNLIVMSDLETSERPDRQGVYAWLSGYKVCGILDNHTNEWIDDNINKDYVYFYGKDSLKNMLDSLMNLSREYTNFDTDMTVFYHNARYDFGYIMHHILHFENAYSDSKLHKFYLSNPVIDDNNVFYSCNVSIRDKKSKRYHFIIRDLYKILPSKLADIGDSVGVPKGKDFDYDMIRPYDYKPTEKELNEYYFLDLEIMVKAYRNLPKFFYKGFTIGSITKKLFLTEYCQDSKNLFPNTGYCNSYVYHKDDIKFMDVISMQDVNKKIIRGYKGGMTIVNNDYLGKTVYNDKLPLNLIPKNTDKIKISDMIYHYDVNSLYPSVMYNDFPIGYPKVVYSDYENSCNIPFENYLLSLDNKIIVRADFRKIINKKGKAPLFLKNDLKNEIYRLEKDKNDITSSNQYKSFYYKHTYSIEYMTLEELQKLKENYNLTYEITEAYIYNKIDNLFKSFVDDMACKKIEYDDDKFLRLCFKLVMNNLYGKFGEKAEKVTRKNNLDENGNWYTYNTNNVNETGNLLINKIGDYFYPPIAIYITSYARIKMIDFINLVGWDKVLYMDTDSIHIADDKAPDILNNYIDDTKLGYLKLEDIVYGEKCVSPKKYLYYGYILKNKVDKLICKCAGLSSEARKYINSFDQFHYGLSFIPKNIINSDGTFSVYKKDKEIKIPLPNNYIQIGKLSQKYVYGGIQLAPCLFSINTPDYLKENINLLDDISIDHYIL